MSLRHRLRKRAALLFASFEMTSILLASYVPSNLFRISVLRAWGAKVGRGCALHHGLQVRSARRLIVAEDCFIAEGVTLDARGGLRIGAHTSINSGAQIWTAQHDVRSPDFAYESAPVSVGVRCWVSARSIVLPGITVGDGTVLAAGAVATKELLPWGVYGRVPARRLSDRPVSDEYTLDAATNKPWWW